MDNETTKDSQVNKSKEFYGIKRNYWFIGITVLVIICICLVVAGIIYFTNSGLGESDPIPGLTPKGSVLSLSLDMIKAQTQEVEEVTRIFLQLADLDPNQPMMDSLDEIMLKEMGMTFSNEVLPWIGRHAGLIVHSIDPNEIKDSEGVLVFSARNKSKADQFLIRFVNYLEESSGTQFELSEIDGVEFYLSSTETTFAAICRHDNFLFLGTSMDSIKAIINLNESESITSLDTYNKVTSALPANSFGSIFLNLSDNQVITNLILKQTDLPILLSSTISFIIKPEVVGIGMYVNKDGLQLETASTVKPESMTDFQKNSYRATFKESNIDQLVPFNSFLFLNSNSSLPPARYFSSDGPLNNPDINESLRLLVGKYGVNANEIANLLTGELGISLNPASGGLLSMLQNLNFGMTLIARTNDETALNTQVNSALDSSIDGLIANLTGGFNLPFMDFFLESMKQPVSYGDYKLQEFTLGSFFSMNGLFVYGADNGYFVFGSDTASLSSSMGGGSEPGG
ncbi:DUF3352 domain-containing protein [Chloroflexota bacterium]